MTPGWRSLYSHLLLTQRYNHSRHPPWIKLHEVLELTGTLQFVFRLLFAASETVSLCFRADEQQQNLILLTLIQPQQRSGIITQ